MDEHDPPVSRVENAKLVTDDKYKCPDCGAPVFANGAAVWCSRSTVEGGKCEYKLMTG